MRWLRAMGRLLKNRRPARRILPLVMAVKKMALLLPGTSKATAATIAESIRRAVGAKTSPM